MHGTGGAVDQAVTVCEAGQQVTFFLAFSD
jgi:hypothetical protein